MVDQNLFNYIQESLASGYSRDQIKNQLITSGWSPHLIHEAFCSLNKDNIEDSCSRSVKKNSSVIWLIISIGAVLLIGLILVWVFLSGGKDGDEVSGSSGEEIRGHIQYVSNMGGTRSNCEGYVLLMRTKDPPTPDSRPAWILPEGNFYIEKVLLEVSAIENIEDYKYAINDEFIVTGTFSDGPNTENCKYKKLLTLSSVKKV